jgi:hypothetical protein
VIGFTDIEEPTSTSSPRKCSTRTRRSRKTKSHDRRRRGRGSHHADTGPDPEEVARRMRTCCASCTPASPGARQVRPAQEGHPGKLREEMSAEFLKLKLPPAIIDSASCASCAKWSTAVRQPRARHHGSVHPQARRCRARISCAAFPGNETNTWAGSTTICSSKQKWANGLREHVRDKSSPSRKSWWRSKARCSCPRRHQGNQPHHGDR